SPETETCRIEVPCASAWANRRPDDIRCNSAYCLRATSSVVSGGTARWRMTDLHSCSILPGKVPRADQQGKTTRASRQPPRQGRIHCVAPPPHTPPEQMRIADKR